jgi:secondary thiamine-phosphate synthase enzyme
VEDLMTFRFENHSIRTQGCGDFVDLTDDVRKLVAASGLRNGMALVYAPHTTCAILINEREAGFHKDFSALVDRIAPLAGPYVHDDLTLRSAESLAEDPHDLPNGHAHVRGALLGSASEAIPVVDGELLLGRWQSVFLVELDRARDRRVYLQAVGE